MFRIVGNPVARFYQVFDVKLGGFADIGYASSCVIGDSPIFETVFVRAPSERTPGT
jgi:hypothetical protein